MELIEHKLKSKDCSAENPLRLFELQSPSNHSLQPRKIGQRGLFHKNHSNMRKRHMLQNYTDSLKAAKRHRKSKTATKQAHT